jgi:hypothetical protein
MNERPLAATGRAAIVLGLLAVIISACGSYETVAINDSQTTSYVVELVSADKGPMGSRFYVVTPGQQELIDNAAMGDPSAQHVSIFDPDCKLLTTLAGPFDEGGVVRISIDGVPVFEPGRGPSPTRRPHAPDSQSGMPTCESVTADY